MQYNIQALTNGVRIRLKRIPKNNDIPTSKLHDCSLKSISYGV